MTPSRSSTGSPARQAKGKHGGNTYVFAFFATFILFVAAVAFGAWTFIQSRTLTNDIQVLNEEKIQITQAIDAAAEGDDYKKYQAVLPIVQSYSVLNWADIIEKLVKFYDGIERDAKKTMKIQNFTIDKGGELTIEGFTLPDDATKSGLSAVYKKSSIESEKGLLSIFAGEDYKGKLTNIRVQSFVRIVENETINEDTTTTTTTSSTSSLARLQGRTSTQRRPKKPTQKFAGGYEFTLSANFVLPDDQSSDAESNK